MSRKHKSEEIQRLMQMMESLGETPDTLADKTGVSARTINNTIWGNMEIGNQLLRGLAKLDISVDWLLTGRGEMVFDLPIGEPPKYLIPYLDKSEANFKDAGDQWLIAARAVEGALVKSGAVPGVDYSRLDLFELAMPFVAQSSQNGECGLFGKVQTE